MFLIPLENDQVYGIKPMNCPGHMLLFGSQLRSYRDLPIRYAEAAPLHRNELAGALHGLTRVRHVTQDDGHIFCAADQIDSELDGSLEYLRYLYGIFGIEPRAELPTRFGLTYMGADNREHPVYVIHRALLGSLERFIGIAIEHYAGAFPLWLAPVQVKVLPVSAQHAEAARAIAAKLRDAGARVEIDDRDETLGKRIRDADIERSPLIAVWGEKETEEG